VVYRHLPDPNLGDGYAVPQLWRWDLIGLPWSEAEPILRAKGLSYRTVVTAPPNRPVGEGELRVVGERHGQDVVELVLAYRTYQRPFSTPQAL
jgi:hypothetical protein